MPPRMRLPFRSSRCTHRQMDIVISLAMNFRIARMRVQLKRPRERDGNGWLTLRQLQRGSWNKRADRIANRSRASRIRSRRLRASFFVPFMKTWKRDYSIMVSGAYQKSISLQRGRNGRDNATIVPPRKCRFAEGICAHARARGPDRRCAAHVWRARITNERQIKALSGSTWAVCRAT